MVFFALFTIGYLIGVISALAIFPPRDREILEQEKDALGPIIALKEGNNQVGKIEGAVGETKTEDIRLAGYQS